MKTKRDDSFENTRLMQSDPRAYFDKLLRELDEIEQQLERRDDDSFRSRERALRGAKR